ncbi:MAG TPA: glutathione S-transferase N-terminal domain-containing protein [Burkholderiales bacterium]
MIDLYTWGTPNGRKISIMLEECGLPYRVHPVNINQGEQFTPEFLAINPNNRIPAIVDPDGPGGPLKLFESGAILIYLAEKVDRFLPHDPRARIITLQWLMFQMGNVGPMFGQAHHFIRNAREQVPYGIKRYSDETRRLYGVMQTRLSEAAYLAGAEYTIADMATYPWVARHGWHKVELADFPAVKRWFDAITARPAVARGMVVPTPPQP